MKPKSRSELEQAASNMFEYLDEAFQPCEALYIVSELTNKMSLAMLQRELEREEEKSDGELNG